jgi:hypothetical protein
VDAPTGEGKPVISNNPSVTVAPQTDLASADDPPRLRFRLQLQRAFDEARWDHLVLAKPAPRSEGPQRVTVRPVVIKGRRLLCFVDSYATKDLTQNLDVASGLMRIDELLGTCLRNAHFFSPEGETQLLCSKRGKAHLVFRASGVSPAAARPAEHNRQKHRQLDLGRPFLTELGVTTGGHQLVPAMASKWKQINKFLEIFEHALDSSPLREARGLRVVDFGAGKAYLSFAVHDWLSHVRGVDTDVVGVELRQDLVDQGNRIVQQLNLQGMHLRQGDVRDWPAGAMDVMIALHACDTATDHAIHLGIRSGAAIILCSPCCHKQLRPQLLSPHPLRSVFQHGIHAEQQAEMLTDSLRALLLESQGYDTQVFEFVSLEHTRKNKMILAVKRKSPRSDSAVLDQVTELKRFFGIREQCLESLLLAD